MIFAIYFLNFTYNWVDLYQRVYGIGNAFIFKELKLHYAICAGKKSLSYYFEFLFNVCLITFEKLNILKVLKLPDPLPF